jgi:hypothetical protein
MKHRIAAACAVLALMGGLAACTGDGKEEPSPSPSSTQAAVPVPIPDIPEGKAVPIKNIDVASSTSEPGTTVEAKGTVTLPEGEEGKVVVSVSWVNAGTNSVYARGQAVLVGMKGGETKDWTATAELPADAEDVQIVPSAVIPGA